MRTRKEENYRHTKSKDGSLSIHLKREIAERLARYCRETNQNRTRFVESCIIERLDVVEKEFLEDKSKEELIDLLMRR